ncbi:TniB family NTP-binding protein [Vogesella sp. LIG4]|uniref:TniB family NTP-binding protein n=1 Tax=Vogesella sp. LIG4 TaxID=1192162 RepID=UPI00081FE589|nr:TniB family NTP-binding protein [Vogesella sp. LIG4]SCK11651.1 AAA domain-containing protein [Vogesella sp. LIG4]
MTPGKQLRIAIEECELPHPLFLAQHKPLQERIEDALDGAASRIERVIGPSRVGKSMLINALCRLYPETKVDGRRHVPVLQVPLPPGISHSGLSVSVLTALGLPVPHSGKSAKPRELEERMKHQLQLAGTRVLMFEEASHLVDVGARVPPRVAADWFKTLADRLNLTLLLFGVPRLERLFECNEQLRTRASASRRLLPYDSRIPANMQAFHSCVATYANLFRESGYPIELPGQALTYQCYLLSGGLIGVLSRFMQELASQQSSVQPCSLTFTDCQAAVSAIEVAGSPNFPAFADPSAIEAGVAPAALHQAFVTVMNDNDLPVPLLEKLSRAAQ